MTCNANTPLTPFARISLSKGSLKWLLLGVVFVGVYFNTLSALIGMWFSSNDNLYGLFIPIISIYIVWSDRKRLHTIQIEPQIAAGIIVTLIGSMALYVGQISNVIIVELFSLVIIIPGLVLLIFGWKMLKALWLPLIYLTFMFPIADGFDEIHWPFQLLSAKIGATFLKLLNIPVFHNVQYLELPNIRLEVAIACSGLNYLVVVFAIGIPLAVFYLEIWWTRILFLIYTLFIGILGNSLRVATIALWSYYYGGPLHGPLHIFQGWFVYVIGFIFLYLGLIFINYTYKSIAKPEIEHVIKYELKTDGNSKNIAKAIYVSIFVLLFIGGYQFSHKIIPKPLKVELNEFPFDLGGWSGEEIINVEQIPYRASGADSELARVYRNASDEEIFLYIGYYQDQKQGKELVNYKLRTLNKISKVVSVRVSSDMNLETIQTIFGNGPTKYVGLYWYYINGMDVTSKYKAKMIAAYNGVVSRNMNGSFILIYKKFNNATPANNDAHNINKFASIVYKELKNYL